MTDDRIAQELETIRILLTLEKRAELQALGEELDEVHELILDELSETSWVSGFTEAVAEKADTSARSVRRRISDLEERQFIARRGEFSGTEYRMTGLARAVRLVR